MELTGAVAIVTGAGRASAGRRRWRWRGAALWSRWLPARNPEVESVAGEVEAVGVDGLARCRRRLGREDDVAGMVDRTLQTYGRVDILVNNAGTALPERPVVDTSPADWERVLRVNLTGPFLCARAVLPIMMRQHAGKIVNVASIGGRVGFAGIAAYGAAKAGLLHFTASLAAEVKRFGIDVNAVCPSGTDTRMLHETGRAKGRTNLIRPEEIANVILFLVSPESSAITGTAIDAYGMSNPLFGPLRPAEK
ncbi:MAG: SDR family oxidoreductase [Rhodopseudomonas palustris]|nr:SDR family oxidoreductase [Rhodopseudomonas palustris]